MDNKSSFSSGNSSPSNTTNSTATSAANRDHFLRHLNKLSHKISKPTSSTSTGLPRRQLPEPLLNHRPPPTAPPLQQPPVYNINKSDFRDVVQKLTGSPSHSPAPAPPIHAPRPSSSRLQRIRPPPLVQLSDRPPPLLNCSIPPMNFSGGFVRQPAPISPLPPLPSCHAAAESPISAYMRFLHNSVDPDQKFNAQIALNPQSSSTYPMNHPPSSTMDSFASSPLPFGRLLSPKSPCPLLSPNLLFSPAGNNPLGFPQLPVSPTVPGVPSPKWRDL